MALTSCVQVGLFLAKPSSLTLMQFTCMQGDIRNNEYTAKKDHLRLIKILGMRHRGPACFDFELYRKRNPDLPKWGDQDLWEHFVKHGQHEGRVFR